jgi:hypothetical protein
MDAQTRSLPTQIRLATLQPGTFNREARTVEVVWTTGARVRRYSWWDDEYFDEELEVSEEAVDMARLGSGAAPLLNSHKTGRLEDQIGVIERAWIAGKEGRALLRLSAREDLAGIVADIEAGIIRNISVGYSVQRYEVTREQGQVPVYRAVRWTPAELSFVTVPADAQAGTRDAPQQGGSPCQIIDSKGNTMDRNDPAATAEPAADPAANPAPAAAPAPAPAGEDVAARAADILGLATRHGLTDQAEGWIRSNKSIEAVRAEILDTLAARSAQHDVVNRSSVMPGLDQEDKQRAAAEEMLLARGFCADEQGKRIVMARDNPFRGYTLMDLARGSLARAGVRTDGMTKLELVGRAFTQTSSDFPTLLENVMHKALQGAYVAAADTWSRWCARGTVSDFRAHNRYRVGSLSNLEPLNESGEFRNKTIPDGEKSSISADTKGNIINLTRKAIINDDLGAFLGLAQAFGRAGARTVEADAYARLLANPVMSDGFALFSNEHFNLGTAAAPSVTSFDAARVLMGAQKDVGGNDFLSLTPAIWLGPLGLGGEARVINDSGYDPDAPNKLQRANKVRGLIRDVVDTPRLTGTGWYMFADPNEAPVIEVAFLDGQDTPFLDSEEGFGVDGVRWKCRLDFGVAVIDYRGAVYNAGAAPGGG